MPNDYKQDVGKVPLLAALQPFAPALYALARMMDDMQHKHRLAGSSDPFNQWAQLPAAKARMAEAMERHLLPEDCTLWDVNTKDGNHLHATHGLFNLLGSLTLHLREQARKLQQKRNAATRRRGRRRQSEGWTPQDEKALQEIRAKLAERNRRRANPALADTAVLRIAIAELRYVEDVPWKVAIDEAVTLASRYGGADSPRFGNGVLDALAHKLNLIAT